MSVKVDSSPGQAQEIYRGNLKLDLLDLANSLTLALKKLNLPKGNLSEIELSVSDSLIVLKDKTLWASVPSLMDPSGQIQIKLSSASSQPGGAFVGKLSFSACENFVAQGQPLPGMLKSLHFSPVIKASVIP